MVVYKMVPGYPGYRVGKDGSVWTEWERGRPPYRSGVWNKMSLVLFITGASKKKYLRVKLSKDGRPKTFLVHHLVLTAFICPRPEGMEGCHENNDGVDNRLTNLRWGTPSSNQRDRVKHGTDIRGAKNPNAKLSNHDVKKIKIMIASGKYTHQTISDQFGVARCTISQIKQGRHRVYS